MGVADGNIFDLQLETERLMLRPPRAGDFEAYAAFTGDPVVMEHLGGVQPASVAWRGFASIVGAWQLHGFAMFSVIEKRSGDWIGRVGPWRPLGWPGNEVGWGLRRESWGQGYAPEAAAASIDWAFATLGWDEVIHVIDAPNESSKAVARKLGSSVLRVDELPEPYDGKPVDIWGQSRSQWLSRGMTGC